jgi:hypothetical protein
MFWQSLFSFQEVGFVIMGAGNPYYSLFCGAKFPVPELTGNSAGRH